jgi:hypothetical protein
MLKIDVADGIILTKNPSTSTSFAAAKLSPISHPNIVLKSICVEI